MPEYKVLRPHVGDRLYAVGDRRTVRTLDGERLVRQGVLGAIEAKAEASGPDGGSDGGAAADGGADGDEGVVTVKPGAKGKARA